MALFGLFGRRRYERAGFRLYCGAVRAAREPRFYTALGVSDTLDGRFDMVGLHVAILINRLQELPPPGPELAQSVFDAMFSDMDTNLREIGVGDTTVGKRVKAMWEAFHGRAMAYGGAIKARNLQALAEALARNVWRGAAPDVAAHKLARYTLDQDTHLRSVPLDQFVSGQAAFGPSQQAAA